MIIFILPGFTSHNPNRKFDILKKYLPNATIVGLTYISNDPKEIYTSFCDSISNSMEYYKDQEIILLGTSLGAFWAKHLAKVYKSKCIIINPALHPMVSLKQHVGLNKNVYTNDVLLLSEEMIKDYDNYYVIGNHIDTLVLLDEGDELFKYKETKSVVDRWEKTQTISYTGGSHAFDHLKEALPEIKKFTGYSE